MSEESKSETYARHQGLFDARFEEIIIKTFVGFERSVFDKLADNDETEEDYSTPVIRINWYGEAAEDLIEGLEDGTYYLPEGTSLEWADGTPLPIEPEEY